LQGIEESDYWFKPRPPPTLQGDHQAVHEVTEPESEEEPEVKADEKTFEDLEV